MLQLITPLSLIKYNLIKLESLNPTPNTFLRVKEREGFTAGASLYGQPVRIECVAWTWSSNHLHKLSAFQRMNHTFNCLVSFHVSRKTVEKTHPRGKTERAIKLERQLIFLDFCAAFFVEMFLRFSAFIPMGVSLRCILSPPLGIMWFAHHRGPKQSGFC